MHNQTIFQQFNPSLLYNLSMKKLNLILIMLSVGLFGVIVFIKLNPETIQKTKEIKITKYTSTKTSREIEIEKFNAQEEKDGEDLFISGWIPDWDIPDGFETLKNQNFNSISPVWFWVNDDGSLQLTTYTNSQEFIAYTKENNIELIPTITLFDAEILNKVLNSPENFERHVEDIVTNVIKNDYDGIDLDYESIYLQDKEEFFELLETLKIRLEEKNKKLVFTAMPKRREGRSDPFGR